MRIIAGTARSRLIETPKGRDTRPTLDRVRENLFNILAPRIPGAHVLDLFSGSGALALEALSRGAASAVLVDRDRAAHLCEIKNTHALGFEHQTHILLRDWRAALTSLIAEDARFDIVFLDPPYAMSDLREVTGLLCQVLHTDALVVTEHEQGHPYLMDERYQLCDQRRYGYVGISMYVLKEETP